MTDIHSVAVIGSGTMGSGIAQICAMKGISTSLVDTDETILHRGLDNIKSSVARFVKSGKVSEEDATAILGRVRLSTSIPDCVADVQVVIEAVPEVLDLKHKVFAQIVAASKPGTVMATNTSQLGITGIASAIERPQDVIGMHFFNPPVLMRLVEVVCGLKTSDRTLQIALALTAQLGKESAVCKRDTVGFITTRAYSALRAECLRIYEEGIASAEDIDKALKYGFNFPMGPFEMMDANGLDVAFYNFLSLKEAYGERFSPAQSLVARVKAGQLGRKTKAGWFEYPAMKTDA